jgi:hypothetical protein
MLMSQSVERPFPSFWIKIVPLLSVNSRLAVEAAVPTQSKRAIVRIVQKDQIETRVENESAPNEVENISELGALPGSRLVKCIPAVNISFSALFRHRAPDWSRGGPRGAFPQGRAAGDPAAGIVVLVPRTPGRRWEHQQTAAGATRCRRCGGIISYQVNALRLLRQSR